MRAFFQFSHWKICPSVDNTKMSDIGRMLMPRFWKMNRKGEAVHIGKNVTVSLLRGASLLILGAIAGCASGPHSSADAPAVTMLPDSRVTLDPAVVVVDHGSLDISGNVHRKATWIGDLSGRVDIAFVGPDGELLDGLPVLIVPREITTGHVASYHVSYGYIPPKGSVLRVHFVDAATMAQEDLEGGVFDAGVDAGPGGASGAAGGNRAAARGTNHYGTNHQMSDNFGTHNFAPGGRR
jgi:hypothetical protein